MVARDRAEMASVTLTAVVEAYYPRQTGASTSAEALSRPWYADIGTSNNECAKRRSFDPASYANAVGKRR